MIKGMLVGLVLVGCGDGGGGVAVDARPDTTVTPGCTGGKTLYLNRISESWSPGADDATTNTSLVLDMTRTLPAYPYGEPSWQAIKACITTQLAPFNVNVVDTDPGTAPHHEIVFTTTYWDTSAGSGIGTISSSSCMAKPVNGVSFVFAQTLTDVPADTCEFAVSQFASETAGLDHSMDCHDALGTYRTACGPKMFLDQEIQCGEFSAHACMCTNQQTQNSFQAMHAALCN